MVLSPIPFFFLFCFITNMLFLYSLFISALSPMNVPLCHSDESSALLQFKDIFTLDCQVSSDTSAYPKVEYWDLKVDDNCCSWDGIECDKISSHVIGLDLSSSCLHGSINSTSSLFNLVHLRNLNLADNNFSHSKIPHSLSLLSKLTHLNFSSAAFAGQIPSNLSQLSKLSTIDLSLNDRLTLKNPNFKSLVQNLTNLEVLRLSLVDVSSTVPNILANLSSLRSLRLAECGLYGEFPIEIFQLPRLQTLLLRTNYNLKGHLPEFNFTNQLQSLMLSETSFSGKIPPSIGNLGFLNDLEIAFCGFFGHVPDSLKNVKDLVYLDLSENNLKVENSSSFLSWISMQTKLSVLDLSSISINGELPLSFTNLTQLAGLWLDQCEITGKIPYWLMNMTQLTDLQLSSNQLQGPISNSILQLKNLEFLGFSFNNLSGTVKLSMFLKFRKLTILYLSNNNLWLLDKVDPNTTTHKFSMLGFGSCNLSHFPHFLRDQDDLQKLILSGNNIKGQIPKWVWNTTKDTLEVINLSGNFLTGFEKNPTMFPWTRVKYLDLSYNKFQGSLPILPSSVKWYDVGNNNFTGKISPMICTMKFIDGLDLSNNNLSGMLPTCLGNFSTSIQFMNLRSNNFHGKIPQTHTKQCNLRVLILDSNQFEGQVPRSLFNCSKLESLILGNNQINDVFPSWLGALQWLKILILRFNQFHGVLGNSINNHDFFNLHIIDLSHNNFSGQFPTQYFQSWNSMRITGADELRYLKSSSIIAQSTSRSTVYGYEYTMSIINKGTKLEYQKILESFMAIDLSSNKFQGDIPEIIGNLIGVRLLNLSNNNLNGRIPSSLRSLVLLESLDLSRNHLSGEIPQQLSQLIFLVVFNVSYNHLVGPIPEGKQFDTFQNDSYINNSKLCGNPLSRKCENSKELPSSPSSGSEVHQDSGSTFAFGWKPVLMGYGSGVIIGAVIGHYVTKWKYEWFLKTFRVRPSRTRT